MKQSDDLSYGDKNEQSVLPLLQTLPHPAAPHLRKTAHKYSVLDFKDPEGRLFVELKSRRIAHDKHPTAIVGWNKVCDMEWRTQHGATGYFAFAYTDGVYAIKYEKAVFDTFEKDEDYWRSDREDCVNKAQHIILIPYEKLERLDTASGCSVV
jgi:hypothetical protein